MAWRLVCEEMSEKFGRQYDSLESGILEKITSWPFFANLRFIDPPDDDEGIRYCNVESEEIVEVVEELDSIEPKRECAIAISKPKTALVPSSKKLEKKTKGKDTVDKITSVLENLETPDSFETTGQALSAKLREIHRLDKLTAEDYCIILDEIQVQMSRSIYDLQRARAE
ncbi:unnamed protein product [Cylicocyclus nassatus]|uniref:Uncharacterized protein n=1 Tax=Cylicocyclus nassatus TaxID=53992 RepID=A0AA36MED2_CYLNA|nr:unnamed protein product [Cylicocyclus nassatus]